MDLLLEPSIAVDFAERINAAWRRSVESIFEVGRLLNQAKLELKRSGGHGHFERMIKDRLPFDHTTAERLMQIGGDTRLAAHAPLLPASWYTIHLLHKLDNQTLEAKIKDGTIRPSIERAEVEKLIKDSGPVNGQRAIAASRQEPDDSDNFFPTPPWATRALFEHIFPHLNVHSFERAWEPACGEGHMSEVLKEYFGTVISSDIKEYGYSEAQPTDFLSDKLESDVDWIITNPPFGDATLPFIQRARERTAIGMAMFVRSQWAVEGVERYQILFKDYPPTLCGFFTERVNLCKGRWDPEGSTLTAYCWLVWMHGAEPRAPFWIPPGCRESLTHTDDVERFTQHPVMGRE